MQRLAAVAAAAIATVVLAACATTIQGTGRPAVPIGSASSPGPTDTGSGAPSGFPTDSGSPSAGATDTGLPSTSSGPPARASLSCAAKVVTTTGAPFCFTVPSGFEDASSSLTYPGTPDWKTGVTPTASSATERDLILVLGYIGDDTDDQATSDLQDEVQSELTVGKSDIVKASPLSATSVDGARAFASTVQYKDGVVSIITIVFRGTTSLSVQCQSQATSATIAQGCASVLGSLQLLDK